MKEKLKKLDTTPTDYHHGSKLHDISSSVTEFDTKISTLIDNIDEMNRQTELSFSASTYFNLSENFSLHGEFG